MNKSQIKLVRNLAEEAIFSSKGHFKTSDWINRIISIYILVPLITSSITFIFQLSESIIRILSLMGILFAFLAITNNYSSNKPQADDETRKHMELANKYLELYKELREIYLTKKTEIDNNINQIRKKISVLDQESSRYKISAIARLHTQLIIRKEVDLSWIYES